MSENVMVQLRSDWTDARISLPESICEKLGLKERHVLVAFGTFRRKVRCIQDATMGKQLRISSTLARSMGLVHQDQIKVKYSKGVLTLGPLIAIFTNGAIGKVRPFGEQTKFLRELSEQSKEKHYLVCVFATKDVHWERRQIHGRVAQIDQEGNIAWQRRKLPFPNVFYDRFITYRLQKPDLALKRKLLRQVIPFFNGVIGDKAVMHQKYLSHPQLRPHLPETKEFRHNLLQPWLSKYRVLYIKPRMGTQGKGIIRIAKQKDGYQAFCVSKGGPMKTFNTKSLAALKLKILTWMQGVKCIIQQGISLATVDGRNVDYRVLVQKGIDGRWQITGMVARLGRKGSVVNNIHGGGDVLDVHSALDSYFGDNSPLTQQIIADLEKVTKLVSQVCDRDQRYLGELGVDLGVDVNGRVWVIEANPKPGRSVFSRVKAYELRRQAVIQPMNYAAYIAGFGIPRSKGEDGNETV